MPSEKCEGLSQLSTAWKIGSLSFLYGKVAVKMWKANFFTEILKVLWLVVVSVSDVMVKNQYLDDIPDGFQTYNTFRWTANRKCSKYHLKDDKMVHTKNFTFHLATHSNCNFFTVFKSMNMKKLCDRVLFITIQKNSWKLNLLAKKLAFWIFYRMQ